MNELIRELARQADPDYTGEYNDDMGHALVGDQAIQKFAELIVRECLDQLQVVDLTEDFDKGIAWSAVQIKKHFGVEE